MENKLKEAIILAGGFGSRLKEVIKDVPKPMAPINDKPFLELIMANLKKYNFSRIVLAVGYLAHVIIDYFGNDYQGMEIIYSKEDTPLKTGGAIKKALEYTSSDYVYVINGDSYLEIDYNMHTNSDLMLACKYLDDTSRYGSIEIKDNKIVAFKEKDNSSSGYINAGIYLIKRYIFKDTDRVFSFEKDFLEKNINELTIDVYYFSGLFIDIGIPEDYNKLKEYFKYE